MEEASATSFERFASPQQINAAHRRQSNSGEGLLGRTRPLLGEIRRQSMNGGVNQSPSTYGRAGRQSDSGGIRRAGAGVDSSDEDGDTPGLKVNPDPGSLWPTGRRVESLGEDVSPGGGPRRRRESMPGGGGRPLLDPLVGSMRRRDLPHRLSLSGCGGTPPEDDSDPLGSYYDAAAALRAKAGTPTRFSMNLNALRATGGVGNGSVLRRASEAGGRAAEDDMTPSNDTRRLVSPRRLSQRGMASEHRDSGRPSFISQDSLLAAESSCPARLGNDSLGSMRMSFNGSIVKETSTIPTLPQLVAK